MHVLVGLAANMTFVDLDVTLAAVFVPRHSRELGHRCAVLFAKGVENHRQEQISQGPSNRGRQNGYSKSENSLIGNALG